MSTSDWPLTRPHVTVTCPPVLNIATDGHLTQQVRYILILRTLYSNPHNQLLKVFNALFFPPSTSPLPLEMKPKEWHHLWAAQTMYGHHHEDMQTALEALSWRKDWVCYRAPGEEEVIDGITYRKSEQGVWEDVLDFIRSTAASAGVVLIEKASKDRM